MSDATVIDLGSPASKYTAEFTVQSPWFDEEKCWDKGKVTDFIKEMKEQMDELQKRQLFDLTQQSPVHTPDAWHQPRSERYFWSDSFSGMNTMMTLPVNPLEAIPSEVPTVQRKEKTEAELTDELADKLIRGDLPNHRSGLEPGVYLVNRFPIGNRFKDGLLEVHQVTELTALCTFFDGDQSQFGVNPSHLEKFIDKQNRLEHLLLADFKAEFDKGSLAERRRLAEAVRKALARVRAQKMEVPKILTGVEDIAEKCLARFRAEQQSMDLFGEMDLS